MYPRLIPGRVATVCLLVLSLSLTTPVFAQRNKSKFKKGDRVEVRDGFDWKPATVVSVDDFSGWVKAHIERPSGSTSRATEDFPPSYVRASHEPKPQPAANVPIRKWTDRTGKFSVDARYHGMNGDKVVLAKADGKQIEVPTDKLSDEDARYLLSQKNATDSPFQEVADSSTPAAASAPLRKAIWDGAKLIQPQEFSKWSFTAPAGKGSATAPIVRVNANVSLSEVPDSDFFFESVEGIYASDDGSHVVVCRNRGDVHQQKAMFLETVDVQKQHAGGLVALPETTQILDVNPSSNLVMYRPTIFGSGENGVLTIARFDGGKLTPTQSWEPYVDESFAPSRDIEKAWFLADNRVMTINGHGKALTIWDVSACKALVNIPVGISFDLQLSLSPDRQLLAIIMKKGIALIDMVQGRHVATIPTSGRRYEKVAIRADNTKLAGLSDEGVTVWNLNDGTVLNEFYGSSSRGNKSLDWAGDFLLADGQYLFDVDRRILLWEYQNGSGIGVTTEFQNGRLYAAAKPMGRDGKIVLVSTAVPHESVLAKAKSLPPADALLVVKPDDEVAIEVDIDSSVFLADEIQKSMNADVQEAGGKNEKIVVLNPNGARNDVVKQMLAKSLEEAGFKVVEHSDLVVKAVCKPQPQQTIRINVDGRFPPRPQDIQERSMTPHASYLEMSLKGQVLWKRGFVARPQMMIFIQRGETLDQALERYTKPNVGLFLYAKFCPYVAKPGKATPNGAYGVSQFTVRGIVDGHGSGGSGGQQASFE